MSKHDDTETISALHQLAFEVDQQDENRDVEDLKDVTICWGWGWCAVSG